MRRNFLFMVTALVMSLACSPVGYAGTKVPASFSRAEIYLVRWEIMRDTALAPDVVRSSYHALTVLRDEAEIAGLLRLLNPDALHPAGSPSQRDGDFRLVIDFDRGDGTKETFAAERGRLVRLSDGASRPIDADFRRRFSFSKLANP